MSKISITDCIPHREPMLLIDVVDRCSPDEIVCRRRFRADEFFFQGHYPGFPLVPGVILCECAAQAAAILIGQSHPSSGLPSDEVPVLTRMNNVRFKNMVRPEDEIEISVRLEETVSSAWLLSARIRRDGKLAASLDLVCASAPAPDVQSAVPGSSAETS